MISRRDPESDPLCHPAKVLKQETRRNAGVDVPAAPQGEIMEPIAPEERHLLPRPPPPPADFAASVRATTRSMLEVGELRLPSVAEASGTI
jgi:hypothetical protein